MPLACKLSACRSIWSATCVRLRRTHADAYVKLALVSAHPALAGGKGGGGASLSDIKITKPVDVATAKTSGSSNKLRGTLVKGKHIKRSNKKGPAVAGPDQQSRCQRLVGDRSDLSANSCQRLFLALEFICARQTNSERVNACITHQVPRRRPITYRWLSPTGNLTAEPIDAVSALALIPLTTARARALAAGSLA